MKKQNLLTKMKKTQTEELQSIFCHETISSMTMSKTFGGFNSQSCNFNACSANPYCSMNMDCSINMVCGTNNDGCIPTGSPTTTGPTGYPTVSPKAPLV